MAKTPWRRGTFKRRRKKVIRNMEGDSAMLLVAPPPAVRSGNILYPYRQNSNIYYLSGIEDDSVALLIVKRKNNPPGETIVFIEPTDQTRSVWIGEHLSKEAVLNISEADRVEDRNLLEKYLPTFLSGIKTLYLQYTNIPLSTPLTSELTLVKKIKERFPDITIRNAHDIISPVRYIKEPQEIEWIKKAIEITGEAMMEAARALKPGMLELQVQGIIEGGFMRRGARRWGFPSIVATGKNATILHYTENTSLIKARDAVLMDIGAEYNYYSADITRVVPAGERFTNRQKRVYKVVLEVQKAIIEEVKPGITLTDLQKKTKELLFKALKRMRLVKDEGDITKYYPHGIGHPLGMDAHDPGIAKHVLKPGCVITIEPGLYIREWGIGIRIEDDILITKDGCKVLSSNIPKEIEDIESLRG